VREKAQHFTDAEHRSAMFTGCRRPSGPCGGRVFWAKAEPRYYDQLGYEGTCSWCGWMTYTLDALKVEAPARSRSVGGYHKPSTWKPLAA
jgi:hypothetical protein